MNPLYIHIFEGFGMIFSMLGAFFMSANNDIDKKYLKRAFIFFLISNFFMIIVSAATHLVPLTVQMSFFAITAINGIYSINRDKLIRNALYTSFTSLVIIVFFLSYSGDNAIMKIENIDIVAALMAIVGSYILAYNKIYAFILFFLADILYVFIAYENTLPFFMIQSMFFIYTSSRGLIYELNANKKTLVLMD